ncbi:MAG: tRNA lysidine(34) synthetase TilS [Pseudomonadota bacterium]
MDDSKKPVNSLVGLVCPPWPLQGQGRLLVALSGGLDSTVLFHSLIRWRATAAPGSVWANCQISAVHLNHGLQNAAVDFEDAVRVLCQSQSIPLEVVVERPSDEAIASNGVEAAAREVRHRRLRELAKRQGAVLVLAHHLNDQVETALLQWVRGAGVEGLSSMLELSQFDGVWLWRPLLGCSRVQLEAMAADMGLQWVEDPTNGSLDYDRNRVRQRVIPELLALRQGAMEAMGRSISHLQSARRQLEEFAEIDLRACAIGNGLPTDSQESSRPPTELSLALWRGLSPDRQRSVLRHWIRSHGLPMPPARRLDEFVRQLLAADSESRATLEVEADSVARRAGFRVWLRAGQMRLEPNSFSRNHVSHSP